MPNISHQIMCFRNNFYFKDYNANSNNNKTTNYKKELNFENVQEKSRLKQNEFKRLFDGGEGGI